MQIFPAQYSTLSAIALQGFLSKQYNLGQISCKLLMHNVSDTYLLHSDSQRFIFKIYRSAHRSADEIRAEVELLTILQNKGASVAYPIANIEGNMLQDFQAAEGIRYGVLFTFAEGTPVYALNDQELALLGREMAKVHEITTTIELNYPRQQYNLENIFYRPLKVLKPAFEDIPDEYEELIKMVNLIVQKLEVVDCTGFSYGYCQYDFLPKNFHFASSDKLTFFDFDFAGQGYIANDIASFYVHYFIEVVLGKLTKAEADRQFAVFVESYREVRPFSDEELSTVAYFGFGFWVFYLGFQYENYDDWSSMFFNTRYLKERVGVLKKWIEQEVK
ncbi:phosphotransferase enzyme family protein [Pedobacter sp. BMA]|uniref:phosphotransferase enzyme family protein n=1 Tax=Pedobacter sp. BMA TaxID=1663685 RepID=UPI00064B2D2D|nr:phosphotransferase [Pedobacter sp. BMA]KLT65399.1 hypothetical protein AB669_09930 [Pedobacter sp. BMA]